MTNPAPEPSADALDKVETALTRSVDAMSGFETMVEKAEPEFVAIAQKFRDMHTHHSARLAALLSAEGREPDADGSVMSSVNTAVVTMCALFDEINEDVMDKVRSGEQHVLKALGDAADHMDDTAQENEIRVMIGDLNALLAETKHLD